MPGIDRFRRDPRGGDAQAMRQGMRQGFRGATVTVIGVRQRQDHGHKWNTPWPWMECAMAMNGMGPWP